MKILFTGASSFTGYHFVRELATRGHEVTATFRKERPETYEGKSETRVRALFDDAAVRGLFSWSPDRFESRTYDLLCLHGAQVTSYNSPDFDFEAAFNANLRGIGNLLHHAKRVIVSRTVFEFGPEPLTPYARSKLCTFKMIETACANSGIPCQSFFIANPFGPLQDRGLFVEICKDWAAGRETVLREPKAARDWVYVDSMAAIYPHLIEGTHAVAVTPTGIIATNEGFVKFVQEMLNQSETSFWRTIREEYKP